MDTRLFFIFFLFFIHSIYLSFSQDLASFHFKTFQVNSGLSQNTVNTILQDRKGYIWIGTNDGLNKFDGSKFSVFRNREDGKSLGNNIVISLVEGNNGELYVGTDDGLYIMNPEEGSFESLESKLNMFSKMINSITSLFLDKEGILWITTMSQGIFKYDSHRIELSRVRSEEYDFTQTRTWTTFQDRSGIIWVGTRIGLFRYNVSTHLLEPVEDLVNYSNSSEKEVLTIFEDEKGYLWLGTWSDGIICYNKQQSKVVSYYNDKESGSYYITHIRSFLQYDHSHLLVGADDGLYLFNILNNDCKRIDIPYYKYSIGDQNVYSMLRDREGGIWIGTYFGGLNYLNTFIMDMESYLPNNQQGFLSGKAISQFCEDESGNLWIATEDGGLNYFNTKTKEISQPVQTSYHNIHPLFIVDDELWIGTFSRGLDVYDLKTRQLRNYRNEPGNVNSINDDCIFSIYQTKKGDIYVGTTRGLNKYDRQSDSFTRIETDSITFVYDIKEDSYHNLWIASNTKGVIKWDAAKNRWIYYSEMLDERDPVVNSRLTGIYIDNQKRLWFSSEGRGIFLYDYANDSFRNISEKDGLPNNVVYGILDDQFGNLWLSSNQGLVSFHPSDISKQKRVSQEDGLQSLQFNLKSSYKSSDGKLYFGGVYGFNCFYPKDLSSSMNTIVPSVEITGVDLLNGSIEEDNNYIARCLGKKEPLRLSRKKSSFTISYTSLSYVSQSRNQFAYKLEGADQDWNYVGNTKSVTYVNLAPGKYTFRVIGSNNDGVWNEEGSELIFEILPPLWWSLPAKITYSILLAIFVIFILRSYIKINRKKQLFQLESYKTEQETLSLKSKIEFFTNIAHEIRTPVSLIQAPLEEIIHSGDGNENTRQNLSLISKNSERLIVLINQLLDFRRMDSAEYVINAGRINLPKFITELYERFLKTAQKGKIGLELILPDKPEIWIISDADALTKIIGNFLTNGLKYTKDKVILELSIYGDREYVVSVKDNGTGIPDDEKEAVFEPFYRIRSNVKEKGSGIGLFLAKYLSNVLGGEIVMSDNIPSGTVFSFFFTSLPEGKLQVAELPEIINEYENKPVSATSRDKRTILIVDDNTEMLGFMRKSLHHYHIDTVESAIEALKMIEQTSYDLIISDLMMPDIDGLSFTRMLRENINYSHIPIIILSAKTDNSTKVECLQSGADVFIEKPFSISFLIAQISSLLSNRKAIIETFNRSPLMSYSILSTNRSDQEFLSRLNDEIDKHISESNFSIELLSDRLLISRSNLQRKLKNICGYTPGDYLKTYRLKKAAVLLLENKLLINEVAYKVGFGSSSYFTKCFVKQFGMLPKEFIRRHTGAFPGDTDV
jgi:ligand-binding sensor domain-containing protein/signal transduction histidine kinase/DNA-binding response OmpR family regulator